MFISSMFILYLYYFHALWYEKTVILHIFYIINIRNNNLEMMNLLVRKNTHSENQTCLKYQPDEFSETKHPHLISIQLHVTDPSPMPSSGCWHHQNNNYTDLIASHLFAFSEHTWVGSPNMYCFVFVAFSSTLHLWDSAL